MKAKDVASYIIASSPTDNLKLQKLLYYCQAVSFFLTDKELFSDNIEAWQYGPVVSEVYKEYKSNGFDIILPSDKIIKLSGKEREIIDLTLSYYGEMSGLELMKKTHKEFPWLDNYSLGKNNIIPKEDIKKFAKETYELG